MPFQKTHYVCLFIKEKKKTIFVLSLSSRRAPSPSVSLTPHPPLVTLYVLNKEAMLLHRICNEERWPSGRRRSPAKRVRGHKPPSRVQIPPSPPHTHSVFLRFLPNHRSLPTIEAHPFTLVCRSMYLHSSRITELAAGEPRTFKSPSLLFQSEGGYESGVSISFQSIENLLFPRHYRICVKKIDCTSVKNLPRGGVELEDLAST